MNDKEAIKIAMDALIYHTMQTRPIYETDLAIKVCQEALNIKPLTLGGIQRLWSGLGTCPTLKDRVNNFARSVEAFHGITYE
jgi:hypothetical protein